MFSICSVWNLSTNINSACYKKKKNVETELITFFRILPDEVIEVPVNLLSHSYCFFIYDVAQENVQYMFRFQFNYNV